MQTVYLRPLTRSAFVAVPALALFGLLTAGCKDGIQDNNPPILQIQEEVLFNPIAVGSTDTQFVQIENVGGSTLSVNGYTLSPGQGPFEVEGLQNEDESFIVLEPGDVRTLRFLYTAESTDQVRGTLEIDTNGGDPEVILRTTQPEGLLDVSPNPVLFGRVASGTCSSEEVTLLNRGNVAVDVESVLPVDPSGEFTLAEGEAERFPIQLAPSGQEGDSTVVEVTYCPAEDNRDESTLLVLWAYGDEATQESPIPMEANGAAPCISVTHEEGFSFGPSLISQTKSELFTITNCSSGDNGENLIVTSLGFLDDPEVPLNPNFGLENLPTFPIELAPEEFSTFLVTYTPDQLDVADRTLLTIVSNDEVKSPLDIEITGLGSNNACPNAVATCVVRGSGGLPSDELLVVPLDTLDCSGAASSDPDGGTIISYQWTVLSQPEGSTTTFDSANAVNSSLFVDIAGPYELQLDLVDDAGASACTPVTINVLATYDEDISAQLVWTTPGDPDETDEGLASGSDVDLHFLNVSKGCWSRAPWDCHWRNKTPDWGVTGNSGDDPSLDIDDVNGAGPENINLDNPEAATYRVGVNYYDDHGFGPSIVTIRIFIFGSIVLERTKELPSSNVFWVVADVTWPAGTITFIDQIYPNITGAPCP
jgi:hypothetical protein